MSSSPITLSDRLLARMQQSNQDSVFTALDFLDLGSRAGVDQALSRLARRGMVRRVGRGRYDIPRLDSLIGTVSPQPDAVAAAAARQTATRLLISPAHAANLLGLSTQVPAQLVYATDGATRRIPWGRGYIRFQHAAPSTMRLAGTITGVVVQAFRSLGRGNITPTILNRLARTLSPHDKAQLFNDAHLAPAWMRPLFAHISAGTDTASATPVLTKA